MPLKQFNIDLTLTRPQLELLGLTMTLPDERYRAVVQTRRFLLDLCNPEHTPRVPKIIRQHARSMLRHYPSDYDMQQAAQGTPEVFQERMEPVNRWLQTGLEKNETQV